MSAGTKALKAAVRRSGLRRARVASARMCCERNLLATIHRGPVDMRPRILCYHSVGTPEWGVNDVRPAQFARQIEVALEAGRRFVPARTIANGEGEEGDLAITFDDGLASVKNALPILAGYQVPATVFVVTEWSDGKSGWPAGLFLDWRAIDALHAAGMAIGSHSLTHPNFGGLELETAREELVRSREIIASRTGIEVDEFAAPFGQSRDWSSAMTREARAAGYRLVYAQSEERRAGGTIPRTFVTRWDSERVFRSAIRGTFDRWEEWM